MSRYVRNTVILAKVEATYGTDAAPAGASDAILVSDFSITPLDAQNIDRNIVRGYFGASEQLVGAANVKCSFSVELAGSGTAGTAPQWGRLLTACAGAEASALTARNRCEYTPVSTALKSVSIYYYDDGVLHKLLGAMGDMKVGLKIGERPMLSFDFVGLDGGISAATPSGTSYAAFKTPVPVTKANTAMDVKLGVTWAAATGFAAGTAYPSTGLELAWNNKVSHVKLLSSERIDITDRAISGSVTLDLTPAQEVSLMATVKANSTQALGFTLGSTAGNILEVYAPAVQLINPKKADVEGSRLVSYDLRLVPSAAGSGNDEIKLVLL